MSTPFFLLLDVFHGFFSLQFLACHERQLYQNSTLFLLCQHLFRFFSHEILLHFQCNLTLPKYGLIPCGIGLFQRDSYFFAESDQIEIHLINLNPSYFLQRFFI